MGWTENANYGICIAYLLGIFGWRLGGGDGFYGMPSTNSLGVAVREIENRYDFPQVVVMHVM